MREEMTMKFVRHSLSVFVCACGLCASGATDNWWRGTVDDNWSTPGNWSCEHVPTADEDVYVGTSAEPIVIFVSGEKSVNKFVLQEIAGATATGPSVTAKKVVGTPSFGDKIKGRIIDNGDGTFAVQAKTAKGLMLIFR